MSRARQFRTLPERLLGRRRRLGEYRASEGGARFLRRLPYSPTAHVLLAATRVTLGLVLVGVAVLFLRAISEFGRAIPVPPTFSSVAVLSSRRT